jgi:hypothetical protein
MKKKLKVKKSMLGIMGGMFVEEMSSFFRLDKVDSEKVFVLLNRKLQEIKK